MKPKKLNTLLALFFLAFFSLLSTTLFSQLACAAIVHTRSGASGNFVVKKDGNVIQGNKVYASWGNLRVDDQKIDDKDVKEYHRDGFYYIFYKRSLLKRVFAAKKFNVYASEVESQSFSSGKMNTRYSCAWYIENLETGKISLLEDLTSLHKFVSSCPAAVALLDLKAGALRKAVRNDRHYINNALEMHENGCKPVAKQQ
jgi:hypothetical protein